MVTFPHTYVKSLSNTHLPNERAQVFQQATATN